MTDDDPGDLASVLADLAAERRRRRPSRFAGDLDEAIVTLPPDARTQLHVVEPPLPS